MQDGINVVKGICAAAEKNIKKNDGDYIGEDGLLYCGKCNTRKQSEYKLPWGVERPYHLCKCGAEAYKAEQEEIKRRENERKIKAMRRDGFPETDMQKWTFENDDRANEKITNVMQKYVENFAEMKANGKGLLLYGDVGTGKTFYAACVANALIDKGRPCLMTNFARLTNTINGMYEGKQKYIDSLNRFSLLVIDDLASERNTEYMNEIVFNIIDSRYRAGLPIIITTNLTGEELKNPAEISKQRVYSRLFDMCIPIEVKGIDRRRERLKDDFKAYAGLLGL